MDEYYFDGDPATDSTRRHLERVLEGRPAPRWPWVATAAALVGGAAFAFWRLRARRAQRQDAASEGARRPLGDSRQAGRVAASAAPRLRGVSRTATPG